MLMTYSRRQRRAGQRGLSIIEFMVGVTVGLFVVGGATKLFVDFLGNNRRLLLETRVNQDLRAAADLIARDLRRGGYWRNAIAGVSSDPLVAPIPNPYSAVTYDAGSNLLSYSYAKDADNTYAANTVEDFRIQRAVVNGVGVVQLRTADAWQTITDPGTLGIPVGGLAITETAPRVVPLWDACPCLLDLTCQAPEFAGPVPGPEGVYYPTRPRVTIRQYQLSITGTAPGTPVTRTITEMIRVRNDLVEGTCPTF
jgi:prepilin peptidase dependent protein B